MYTPTLLTAAFAILAFASEQGTQGEECDQCDSSNGGSYGGGRGLYGGGFTNRRPSGYGDGGREGGSRFSNPCQDGDEDSWDGHQMRCNNDQWQYELNGQWYTWSSTSNTLSYQNSDGNGNRQSGTFSSTTNTASGGYFKGQLSASNQIPLHFDDNQYDVPLNTLYPYDTTCSHIDFPQDDPCVECAWKIQDIQCKAFGDNAGTQQIGSVFRYGDGCDFGQPTQVHALLCTVS